MLVGTAGATLLALLFVAVSLGAGYLSHRQAAGTRTFMSPLVIHFTSVFFISAVALVPAHHRTFFAVLIAATALIGAAVSSVITVQVLRTNMTQYVQDYFAYGLLPVVGYLALLAAAVLIYDRNDYGLDLLAAGDRQHPQRLGSDAVDGAPPGAQRRGRRAPALITRAA